MANVLNQEERQQVLALGRPGWSLRRIQQATNVRRETASADLKAAGSAVRLPSGWGRGEPKPANQDEVITDSAAVPGASACEPYREAIDLGAQSRPQCHGDLAGFGFRVRIREQLPKRATLRTQATRYPNPRSPVPSQGSRTHDTTTAAKLPW
jgi:hypothetical protein